MKKQILLTGVGLIAVSCLGYFAGFVKYHQSNIPIVQITKQVSQDPLTKKLIQETEKSVEGDYILEMDMASLKELYKDAKAESMPRIFVEKIPDDFVVNSVEDQTLFMKLMTPHLLRVNEQIMRERKVILILEEKVKQGKKLTREEEEFLSKMEEKYDVLDINSRTGRLSELILRVDVVPVSLGMAVAIWATNWGQKEKESPFFEHAWNDKVEYTTVKFSSLSEASESFALQINSRSQLLNLRGIRAHFRLFKKNDTFGQDLVYHMMNYAHFIPSFMDQLLAVYSLGYIKEMDEACFENGCGLTK